MGIDRWGGLWYDGGGGSQQTGDQARKARRDQVLGMLQVLDGPKSHKLTGRAAAIVRWLTVNAQQINGHGRLKLQFDCAGRKVKANKTVVEGEELTVS